LLLREDVEARDARIGFAEESVDTTYGGDGRTNFALPDLRGMVAPFKPLSLYIALNAAFPRSGGRVDWPNIPVPYVGEDRMLGSNFVLLGWSPCDGRLLSLDPYQGLFSVLRSTFGSAAGVPQAAAA
jgi:microcystin-dependent protein